MKQEIKSGSEIGRRKFIKASTAAGAAAVSVQTYWPRLAR